MATIYHITTKAAWKAAKEKGFYEAESLATEGFIHCCELKQMRGVLKRYYEGQKSLLALTIDTELLEVPLKYEPSPTVKDDFPHIYGPIPVTAVVEDMDL
jgi:uncharacterized protein (DUF952 family)